MVEGCRRPGSASIVPAAWQGSPAVLGHAMASHPSPCQLAAPAQEAPRGWFPGVLVAASSGSLRLVERKLNATTWGPQWESAHAADADRRTTAAPFRALHLADNAAVAAGRMDLVRDLANDCQDEALDLMLALGGDTPSQPNYDAAEILEFGGGRPQRRRAGRPGTRWFQFLRYNRR
jgi:hypothetical protein